MSSEDTERPPGRWYSGYLRTLPDIYDANEARFKEVVLERLMADFWMQHRTLPSIDWVTEVDAVHVNSAGHNCAPNDEDVAEVHIRARMWVPDQLITEE